MYLGALRASRKQPRAVDALPDLSYARPKVVLDSAHIARYAGICGFRAEHGVPVTYPQLLVFPLVMAFFSSPECPWPGLGTVHLANSIEQRRRLRAGDALRVELRSGELIAHEKGQAFTLLMNILRGDDVVWKGTQTLLRLGVGNPAGPAYASGLNSDAPLSRQADFSAASDIGRRYGRVSGDRNPIHLSMLSARLFGFRRAIAHGLWIKARALSALMPAPVAQAKVAVEFKTPLFLPARASLWISRNPQGAWLEVRDAKGEKPHLRGHLSYQQTQAQT